jgi:GNAT superfamily N-acetyltransferase
MEVRPARDDEIDALAALYYRCRNDMAYLPPMPEADIPLVAARIRESDEIWVAERDGRIVGFMAVERSETNGWETLERLYVEPGEQGGGIGTALLDKAKELRPRGLHLWVFQKNEGARRFYERQGFSLVKLTDGSANMEREPDALYRWPSPGPERAA